MSTKPTAVGLEPVVERLVGWSLTLAFEHEAGPPLDHARATMTSLVRALVGVQKNAELQRLRTEAMRRNPAPRDPPPRLAAWLLGGLAELVIMDWLVKGHPGPVPVARERELRSAVRKRLGALTGNERTKAWISALRFAAFDEAADRTSLETRFGDLFPAGGKAMADFKIDKVRGLPENFDEAKYIAAVRKEAEDRVSVMQPERQDVIIGLMLLNEQFGITPASSLSDAVKEAFNELIARRTYDANAVKKGTPIPNVAAFLKVRDTLVAMRDAAAPQNKGTVLYQELASVGRYVIGRSQDVPIDDPKIPDQVKLGLADYLSAGPAFESLDLPDVIEKGGEDDEVEPANIRAVGMIYAAYQLDQARLFSVVDRLTELFMNGLLPVGFDAAGKVLDRYYFESEDRLTESARAMQFSRVLGVSGGDVSRDVEPNRGFPERFMRFVSSVAEYARDLRVSVVIQQGPRAGIGSDGEQVRKAGRELAANTSLYGWGYTHFAARHLSKQIQTALQILGLPEIRALYGVSNPWQVIERVSIKEFGQAPDIVRLRTMASAGKKILDAVARHADKWSLTNGNLLFSDLAPNGQAGDIDVVDTRLFFTQSQYWLAVNGIGDAEVQKAAQPTVGSFSPSIPQFDGAPSGNGSGLDQLKKLVAQGQAPSLEQLQQMVPMLRP